jgi:hypothetical protein
MKKLLSRQSQQNQKVMMFHSLKVLIHTDSEKLLWPNSPLLVLLQFFDPNVLSGPYHGDLQEEEILEGTLLHHLTALADPCDYSTIENQLTLGRQLIEHGTDVNTVAYPGGEAPLHFACLGEPTNLDFIQLLLEDGADPNIQDELGRPPLLYTIKSAPGAAKFLLEWATTANVNIPISAGACFLFKFREAMKHFSDDDNDQLQLQQYRKIEEMLERGDIPFAAGTCFLVEVRGAVEYFSDLARPDNPNPDRAKHQFLLQQWREIEEMLAERGAVHTGITAME